MKKIFLILCVVGLITSCDDFFEPKLTNVKNNEIIKNDPNIVRGLLTYAYRAIPDNFETYWGDFLDCSTDNAVSNVLTSGINKMAYQDGFWTPFSNPLNNWSAEYDNIRHINDFINRGLGDDIIYYKSDLSKNALYRDRLKGEAYFLRAWCEFDLLRRFAGYDSDNNLLGVAIVTKVIPADDIPLLPRDSYVDCVTQIMNDLDTALNAGLQQSYEGASDILGSQNLGRPTTVACNALKSRVLLYAASPAFNPSGDKSKWEAAAKASKYVIDQIGTTLPDIYNNATISEDFYNNDQCEELIMRKVAGGKNAGDNNVEKRNFPPTVGLIGSGRCNPSQNLVDAFPMANGYPITDPASGYTNNNMYMNRDPRLDMVVLHNGSIFKGDTIQTYPGGNTVVGATGVTDLNVSRTGYYLRKWVSSRANLIVGNTIKDYHYFAVFRNVEMFLNYAEAANEAYGPDDMTLGMSARDAIREVRRRAGIAKGGEDGYLSSLTTKEQLRELIRNERRIELCFEGHRFFDLRRWKESIVTPVSKVVTTKVNGSFIYKNEVLDTPIYKEYMYFPPLPKNELLKSENLRQNQGWN